MTDVAYAHSEKGTANNCEVTDCETCNDHAATVSAASRVTNSPGNKGHVSAQSVLFIQPIKPTRLWNRKGRYM